MSEKQSDEEQPAVVATSVTAVPIVSQTTTQQPNVSMHLQEKQGAKCCGCCCDYRRAVVVIAIIFLILSIASLIGAFFPIPALSVGFDDDEVEGKR